MSRLIDAEQLSKHKYVGLAYDRITDTWIPASAVYILTYKWGWNDALDSVERFATTEVVRCKDCKWRGKLGCAVRIVDESDIPNDDDFCSWGERRKDAKTD